MLFQIRTALIALTVSALGLAGPAVAQGEVANAPDPYVHAPTGVTFPGALGDIERGTVYTFDEAGSNIGIGYLPRDHAGQITVYLYPKAAEGCEAEFEGAHEAIVNRSGSVVRASDALSIPAFRDAQQFSRSYRIEAGGYGSDHPELMSFLWVGCPAGSPWIVKYRASFPMSDVQQAYGIESRFLGGIDWSGMFAR